MARERLGGEVHALLELDRVVERVRPGDPHPLIEGEADRMRELLERHRLVLVVGVLREIGGDIGRCVPGLHLLDGRVHRLVALLVEVLLLLRHLAVDLERAHEVHEVATRPDRVLVDDHEVALADHLVGVPAPVRAGVAARRDDDVVDEVEPLLVEVLVHLRGDVALLHAGLQPFVLDLPERRVADRARDLQALDLVRGLDHAGPRHRRPGARGVQLLALERRGRGRVVDVDPDRLLFDAVLLEDLHDRVGHPVDHHLLGRLGPLPGDRRPDVSVQPGRVDLRALEVGSRGLEEHRLAVTWEDAVADKDVVLPVALEDAGDVPDVLPDEAHEGAEVVLLHHHPGASEAVAAHSVEVDAALPVGSGRAVDAAGLELVRLAEEVEVHPLPERRQTVGPLLNLAVEWAGRAFLGCPFLESVAGRRVKAPARRTALVTTLA